MTFATFSNYLQQLEGTASRLEMTALLAQLFKDLKANEIEVTCYLLQGQLVPAYESLEFQLSSKMLIRVLTRLDAASLSDVVVAPTTLSLFATEADSDDSHQTRLTALYKELGDVGLVAEQLVAGRPAAASADAASASQLSIRDVYAQLKDIALIAGSGSQDKKVVQLVTLLQQVDAVSAKYIVRMVMGKLRLGFSTMTMLDALSWSMAGDKSESGWLEDAYQKKADLGKLAAVYTQAATATERQKVLNTYTVEVGIPVLPALCQRLNSAQEIIDKMHLVIVEPKYDGVRVQIHFDRHQQWVKTYTRSLEENSHQFPELAALSDQLQCESCILDAEAIGYDRDTGALLPFQETITRKRKHEVAAQAEAIPLRFYIFDVLSLNGQPLLSTKLQDRKKILADLFQPTDLLQQTPFIVADDPEQVRAFHTQQLELGLEGAVIKQLDSSYQSGRKGWSWVKIKEEEGTQGKLADTLDCVVMGYYVGKGKRTQFGMGAFLVGVLGANGAIQTIAKIGTGLSDDQFRALKQRCQPWEVATMPSNYQVHKSLLPDTWVSPALVVEVAADELTKSPNHTAGLALRFPRLIDFRDDKKWEQATSVTELAQFSL